MAWFPAVRTAALPETSAAVAKQGTNNTLEYVQSVYNSLALTPGHLLVHGIDYPLLRPPPPGRASRHRRASHRILDEPREPCLRALLLAAEAPPKPPPLTHQPYARETRRFRPYQPPPPPPARFAAASTPTPSIASAPIRGSRLGPTAAVPWMPACAPRRAELVLAAHFALPARRGSPRALPPYFLGRCFVEYGAHHGAGIVLQLFTATGFIAARVLLLDTFLSILVINKIMLLFLFYINCYPRTNPDVTE